MGSLIDRKTFVNIIKILVSSAAMGAASAISFKFAASRFGDKLGFLIALAIAGAVYFIFTFALKVDEIDEFLVKKEKNK